MNRRELKALNAELIELLTVLRDLINEQLDELDAVTDDELENDDDPDESELDED